MSDECKRDLTVREATPKDMSVVFEILSEARALLKNEGIAQWTEDYPSVRDLQTDLGHGCLFVVCKEERTIAAAQILVAGDPHYREIDGAWRGRGAHIAMHRVTVAASSRRSGAATALLRYAESLGRAYGALSLRMDTHPDNLRMQRFFEKNGFSFCGRIKEPITGKEHVAYDKLLFAK